MRVARVLNQAIAGVAEIPTVLVRLAGFIDYPVAEVRVRWGAYDGGILGRQLELTVIDRLDKRFAPRQFREADGRRDGRWLIRGYFSASEFGAPVADGIVNVTVGRLVVNLAAVGGGEMFEVLTDERGRFVGEVQKGTEAVWTHVGVPVLLRSRGLGGWETAAGETFNQD